MLVAQSLLTPARTWATGMSAGPKLWIATMATVADAGRHVVVAQNVTTYVTLPSSFVVVQLPGPKDTVSGSHSLAAALGANRATATTEVAHAAPAVIVRRVIGRRG